MNSFKRNLLILYGISFLLLIVSAVASYSSITGLLSSQQEVVRTNDVISSLENVVSALKDAETGQRGFLLTGQERFLEPYTGSLPKAYSLISGIKEQSAGNDLQVQSAEQLRQLVTKRISSLQLLIDDKRKGIEPTVNALEIGKTYMDSARQLVQQMENREKDTLRARTASLNRFSSSTPILIVIASLLSFAVALFSFFRVNNDLEKRTKLQQELEQKDKDINVRLDIIRSIADKISAGDYKTRISDAGQDALGNISLSLNKMAESLDYSFDNLKHNEWLQTGIAGLNDKMIGEKNLNQLAYNVIDFITAYTKIPVGAFYLAENDSLVLTSGIALDESKIKKTVKPGEDLVGQSAISGRELLLEDINETDMVISFSSGSLKPKNVLAVPVFFEGKLKGAIELASLNEIDNITRQFLRSSVYNIGMAIHTARNHRRLEELLAETQAQSEALQSQHNELENINAELEVQAEKLQASEEELKVQQEELLQSNAELEERSRLLEEKNELILERNLEIQAKAEQLELITKYKSEFLANMSHELRTPLNSVLLLSRLLSENHTGNLNKDQIEYATVIQNSGNALLTLINEILDLSKIEAGKMELEHSNIAVKDLVTELNALFEPLAKDKDIVFKIETDESATPYIETDRLRLEQILRNLVANALKFTKHGAVILNIKGLNDTVIFTVTDTGIGIPAEKLETIFEAFQQADGSTKRQYGGTGLGLSISRELARLLSGQITVSSEEGKGSTFTLTIPANKKSSYKPAELKAAETATGQSDITEMQLARAQNSEYISAVIPQPVPDDRDRIKENDKTILIVEDDTAFAKSLLDFTRRKKYKGIVAVRGDEGMELAKKYKPYGILLDIQLPVKSGWEVMDELKSNPETRAIPVHIMSSYDAKAQSLLSGAIDFINKPVAYEKMSTVFQKIEDALSRHPKKVLIVEENSKHAKALAYFLESFNVAAEIKNSVSEGIDALKNRNSDCVILDIGIPAQGSYAMLEEARKTPGIENLPIIIFTGKNLSHAEEMRIKQYADSIVVKTAHSYQRILDEVSLFLHLVEENKKDKKSPKYKKLGELEEVLKGKTVLIADDDVRNIFSLTKSLENYGMHVISAMDGKDALNQLAGRTNVDIVLMDMMMPEMDGYESTKRIRQNPKYRKLPIIAVTAKAMTGDREKCINAGASDYITKPVDADQLISLLRVWLYD
ncbi:response regulator [Parafilimonas sp.]|uniref:response regulator n=1 Tax=Parafilimonas sp. TaxID=1969739 RepID=UPI0039E34469